MPPSVMRRHGAGRATAAQAHLHAMAFNADQFDIAAISQHDGAHLGDTCLDNAQPLFGRHASPGPEGNPGLK